MIPVVHPRSLWDWSCDVLAGLLVGTVFWMSRVKGCPCGDPYCTNVQEEHDD